VVTVTLSRVRIDQPAATLLHLSLRTEAVVDSTNDAGPIASRHLLAPIDKSTGRNLSGRSAPRRRLSSKYTLFGGTYDDFQAHSPAGAGTIVTGGAGGSTTAILSPAGAAPVSASRHRQSGAQIRRQPGDAAARAAAATDVLGMQLFLIGHGAHSQRHRLLRANTVKAVKHYQAKHGLP